MSARSKSSSSSIHNNTANHNNCIRTSQPPITRPLTSSSYSNNDNMRSNQNIRSSNPSKNSIYSPLNRQKSRKQSSLRNSTSQSLNSRSPSSNRASNTVSGRRSAFSFAIKSFLNDQDCISLRNQLMDNNDQEECDPTEIYDKLDDSQLKNLVSHLKEYEQENAINENYIEASKAHHLGLEVHEVLKIRKRNEINSSVFSTSNSRTRSYTATGTRRSLDSNKQKENVSFQEEEDEDNINSDIYNNDNENTNDQFDEEKLTTLNLMKEFDQYYQEKIDEYQKDTNVKIEKLSELHSQQTDALEKEWKEKKPAQYRKPSAQLLQLKCIERNLALIGDYDRAMILHKETESLTRKEMIDAQKRLVSDYKIAKSNLLQRQNQEADQLQQSRRHGLTVLKNEHRLKRQKYENRDKVIQQQKSAMATKRLNTASQSLSVPAPILAEKVSEIQTNLLPELIPPSDFVKEEDKKAREENKRRLEMQQRNIDAIAHLYKIEKETEDVVENENKSPSKSKNNEANKSPSKINNNVENENPSKINNDIENKSPSKIDNNEENENPSQISNNVENENPSQIDNNEENKSPSQINNDEENKSPSKINNDEENKSPSKIDNNIENENPSNCEKEDKTDTGKSDGIVKEKDGSLMKIAAETISAVAGGNNVKKEAEGEKIIMLELGEKTDDSYVESNEGEIKEENNKNESGKDQNESKEVSKNEGEVSKEENNKEEDNKNEKEEEKAKEQNQNEGEADNKEEPKNESEADQKENKEELKNEGEAKVESINESENKEKEQRAILDISVLNSLVGSADAHSSEGERGKK